jgi:hypothetical protein
MEETFAEKYIMTSAAAANVVKRIVDVRHFLSCFGFEKRGIMHKQSYKTTQQCSITLLLCQAFEVSRRRLLIAAAEYT